VTDHGEPYRAGHGARPGYAEPEYRDYAAAPELPAAREPRAANSRRRRQRRRLWPLITAAVVTVITAVAAVVVVQKVESESSAHSPTGPSACALAAQPASRAGSWKMITPRTLCGMLPTKTAQIRQADQAMVNAMQGVVTSSGITSTASVGRYTSAFAQGYQVPANSQGIYRSVSFTGLDGTFSPAAAVTALGSALDTGSAFRSVPAGPHGGAMACAPVSAITEQCVWATGSTLGVIQVVDTTRELVGTHVRGTAVLIRDALEAPA
jgi:hypothetical protein